MFILLYSAERVDLVVVGWFDLSFNVCVTVYLWSCFALCREDRKVYVVILGDVASPVRRRAKRTVFSADFTLEPSV